jgi:WD40 repeat protein
MMHRAGVRGACFCQEDTRVLTWSEDSTAQLWSAADGSAVAPCMVHGGDVHGALLSRDHRRLLTWSEDRTARLWNVDDGTPAARPMEHHDEVTGAAFSRDETRILTWSKDGRVRLWNAADGRLIVRPLACGGEVAGAMFCRGERGILAWGGEYGMPSATLWTIDLDDRVPPGGLVLEVEAVNGTAMDDHGNLRFLTREEWRERRTRPSDQAGLAEATAVR